MKKKRLISLMLTGVMASSVGVMAGCSEKTNSEDVFIVLKQNDVDVLHKGDITVDSLSGTYGNSPTGSFKYSFNCGEQILTNEKYASYNEYPKTERYDEICEGCFNK